VLPSFKTPAGEELPLAGRESESGLTDKPSVPHVVLSQLSKKFGSVNALDNLNLQVAKGEILALVGPSGCGKTTLLRVIAGLEKPDSGTVIIGERVVAGGTWVQPERRGVGIVFQDYALFPHMNVFDNVAFGVRCSNRPVVAKKTLESLKLVGLAGMAARYPHELSGGQQQRVALARALAPGPAVILLDEPFSNLDVSLRTQVREEIKEILTRSGATVVLVTHDQEEALFMGDRIGVINAVGQLDQIDRPEVVFHQPATPFVAQFIGIADLLPGEVQNRVIVTEVGQLPLLESPPPGTKVRVVLRPDSTEIYPAADGAGVIVDRTFQGIHYLYRIRLTSGATIRSVQHHSRAYAAGTRVAVTLAHHDYDREVVYFIDQ